MCVGGNAPGTGGAGMHALQIRISCLSVGFTKIELPDKLTECSNYALNVAKH